MLPDTSGQSPQSLMTDLGSKGYLLQIIRLLDWVGQPYSRNREARLGQESPGC